MMSVRNKVLVTGLFLIPIILLVTLIISKPRREKARLQDAVARLEPTIRAWSSADFVPIEDSPLFWDKVDAIKVTNGEKLNALQKEQLQQTLKNYILAYNVGSFEAFHRFRAPIPEFHLVDSVVQFLNQDLRKNNQSVPTNDEGMFELYWEKYVGAKWEGFWTGISFTNAVIEVDLTNAIPPLDEFIRARKNAGISKAGPMIKFDVTPESILKKQSYVCYATVALLLRNTDVTCPVFCRFYWTDEYQKWLPLEQAAAYSGPRKTTLIF